MEKADIKKGFKMKYLHIAIIVLGIIFITIPIFHQNLWFDESYTIGIVSKSFIDIWKIGSHDVHPVLYYWLLHIIYLIFGSNIYLYRVFSMIPIAILSILGYTHIRKDFGEKVGLLFSFFTLFLPISTVYSGEIRMYTWAMLFVSIMAIYAYRIFEREKINTNEENKAKETNKKERIIDNKNWLIFGIFSLASAYTHYYGLATAGIINVILFIYLIIRSIKAHKKSRENKLYTKSLKRFTISAVLQIALYIPWVMYLITQFGQVAGGFWIRWIPFGKIWLQIFTFQFTGDLENTILPLWLEILFSAMWVIYVIYAVIRVKHSKKEKQQENKNKKNENEKVENSEGKNTPGLLAIGVYVAVILALFLISLKVPILYARYLLNLTGIFFFFMAFFISKGGRKTVTIILSIITIIVSIMVNIKVSKMNYDESNNKPLEYVKQDLKEDDLLFFGNDASGFVISMQLIDNPNCFFDGGNWNVDEAYKAFGKDLKIIKNLDEIKDYEGRMWVIDSSDFNIYREIEEKYGEKINLIKQERFSIEYHLYQYSISLVKKAS